MFFSWISTKKGEVIKNMTDSLVHSYRADVSSFTPDFSLKNALRLSQHTTRGDSARTKRRSDSSQGSDSGGDSVLNASRSRAPSSRIRSQLDRVEAMDVTANLEERDVSSRRSRDKTGNLSHHCRDNGSGGSPLSTMQLLSKIHTHLKGTAGNESDPQQTHGY
jgi:hypothetical protein